MAKQVTATQQLEAYRACKDECTLTRHPRYSEYTQALLDAYQAYHHATYHRFASEEARAEACEMAAKLRAQEQSLYAELTGECVQEVLI